MEIMMINIIRRGVRSDAQLRPTETRFQKCSQSGKNGSKHPMLSISMAYNRGPQRPDFKSALRVVKMVLNTQCYQYLWLTMWFHAKKSKETLKNSKSLILQCKFGSRAQK